MPAKKNNKTKKTRRKIVSKPFAKKNSLTKKNKATKKPVTKKTPKKKQKKTIKVKKSPISKNLTKKKSQKPKGNITVKKPKKTSAPTVQVKATSKTRFEKIKKKAPITLHAEPITFGLLEDEITALINEHLDEPTNRQVEKKVIADLVKMLPENEPIVTSKKPKQYNLVIEKIRQRHKQSPFVLDLSQMIKEKQQEKLKKQLVKEKVKNRLNQPIKFIREEKHTQITISDNEIKKQFTTKRIINFSVLYKPAFIFALVCLAIILPLKAFTYYKDLTQNKHQIINYANQAYDDLKIAGQALTNHDPSLAEEKFQQAKLNFEQVSHDINKIDNNIKTLISIIPAGDKYFTDAKRLSLIGETFSQLGLQITEMSQSFEEINSDNLLEIISTIKQKASDVLPKITFVAEQLLQIDEKIVPTDKQSSFLELQKNIHSIENTVRESIIFCDKLSDILGQNYKRRYLFVFQNNNEIRATGGFLGSFALVDIHDGKIVNLEMPGGGTYDMQGGLTQNIIPPYPLQLINERWEFQDANWFFDFPTSAQKIQWFYEKSGGPSVDGVIALNATLMQKLLNHTKPIHLPDYGKTITAQNFIDEIQKSVELEYDQIENKPKQILADLAPLLIEQIFDKEKTDLLSVITVLKEGLGEKDLLLYFNNQGLQEQISKYDWSGEIKSASKNYLAVVNTNIAGQKTDGKIKQTIDHISQIQADGTIIDTLTIIREHTGVQNELFSGVRNVNFMRIYVPQGSTLINADGFEQPPLELFDQIPDFAILDNDLQRIETNKKVEPQTQTIIYDEEDKTVFGNWTQTDPGEKTVVTIKYRLPIKIKTNTLSAWDKLINKKLPRLYYSIFYQKQPGVQDSQINSKIELPKNFKIYQTYPVENDLQQENIFTKNYSQKNDRLSGIIIEKIN